MKKKSYKKHDLDESMFVAIETWLIIFPILIIYALAPFSISNKHTL